MSKIKNRNKLLNSLKPIAGNGLLDRRLFLQKGLTFTALTAAATAIPSVIAKASGRPEKRAEIDLIRPPWMRQPGKPFSSYGVPSPYEDKVVRLPSANPVLQGNGASWSPLHQLEGTITPNGLHFERHHNGVPQIDPEHHKLLIHGMVEKESFFTIDALMRYPHRSQTCFVECGGNSNSSWNKNASKSPVGYSHGLVSCSNWAGVPLSTLLSEVGVKKKARWLIAEGADAFAMNMSIPLEKAMDDAMLALFQNGERLRPENGYPIRLLVPGWEGVLNVKWVRRIELSDQPVMARNETSKYTELLPSGKSRIFTLEMHAKSLITSPVSSTFIPEPGLFQISGLAWSGRGKVKKVEVSADNGETWAQAALDGPILPKAFTRFRMPWRWDGKPAYLKSRVTDETGYVQPERDELVANRGRHGYFHYNAIMTLAVEDDGFVTHVYRAEEDNQDPGSLGIDADW
ncbi:MAG: sulfite dehydrogenase [Proteobacteria bacterium]|nr:sulfite dehydrogenase [Pseudomonadota bacterium]